MPSIHDAQAVEQFRRRHRLDPQHIRRLRNAFYKAHRDVDDAVTCLPPAAADDARAAFDFHPLRLESRHDSDRDGASKLIFLTQDDHRIESVILRIRSGRTSLCISTQVGCRAACGFCATGLMGLRRNLTVAEILDQLVQANHRLRHEGRAVRNVVFMGMGEPLHNADALHQALDVLTSARGFHHPPSRLLVSTVGVPDEMERLSGAFPEVGLALSLHAARQSVRENIVPLARRHHVDQLRDALRSIVDRHPQRVMIEYVLLQGINDADEDVAALIEWCAGLPVHINLIPYNTVEGVPWVGTTTERCATIANALRSAGHTVTTRYSLGSDIAAACGQLVRDEERRRRPR